MADDKAIIVGSSIWLLDVTQYLLKILLIYRIILNDSTNRKKNKLIDL